METVYNVWLVDFELGQMAALVKTLKTSLEDYFEKIKNLDVTGGRDVMVDDDANDKFNAWSDDVQSVDSRGDYHRRLYSAFIISWYSFVEDNLLKLCDDLMLQMDQTSEIKKRSKSGIWLAHYLIESGTSFRFDPLQWEELILINKIRNQIVHEGGRFAISLHKPGDGKKFIMVQEDDQDYCLYIDKSLYNYLKKHDQLIFYNTFLISPTPEFCEYLVSFSRSLFEDLFKGLKLL